MAEKKKQNPVVRVLKFLFPWKGDSAGEVVRKSVFLISVIAIIVCAVYFAGRFSQRKAYSDTQELTNLISDSDSVGEDGELEKYADLKKINSEFVGWLRIADSGIDVPVVQTGDNETYLRKDFYGNYSVYGNPYLDFRNQLKNLFEPTQTADKNTTIYGHNMLDNMVFAELLNYKKLSYYKTHPTVEFHTVYGQSKWKIIAAFAVNSTTDMDNGYALEFNFVTCSRESFGAYLTELEKRSYFHTAVDVNADDVLLTLSTCDKSDIEEGRFVVVARQVRADESDAVDVEQAQENTNIKFPQGYYDKYKLNNPYQNDTKWIPE